MFSSRACVGIDLGTSTSKIVELVDRKKRIEVVTYAESNMKNILVNPPDGNQDAIEKTVTMIRTMMEKAGTSTDSVVAALPGGSVFSTVLMLPKIPAAEMENAVRFAARDVVPADIDEMVLGWSSVATGPHMAGDHVGSEENKAMESKSSAGGPVPVFITAAPKDVVARYTAVFEKLQLQLLALEVETFPLVRSLLDTPPVSSMVVDIGARATTFHIIDGGVPRVSHTIDFGGFDITGALAKSLNVSEGQAEQAKISYGLLGGQDENTRTIIESAVSRQTEKAKDLLSLYEQKEGKRISKTFLIGGGANLKGLPQYWSREVGMQVAIGNPWKGLTYPNALDEVLRMQGPRYGVAVGLALRGFAQGTS